jgi:hypothetical protein
MLYSGSPRPGKYTYPCSIEQSTYETAYTSWSDLEIPLAHITGVEVNPAQVGTWWHGFKVIGTDVPGLFAAGTFFYHGELVFWDVRHPEQTIIVALDHERYKKLIVEVEDPASTAAMLRDAIDRVKT